MEPGIRQTLIIRNNDRLHRVDLGKILYIQMDNYQANFYLSDKTSYHCCKSMNELTRELPENFVRISRNCLVNRYAIKEIRTKAKRVVLTNNSEHKVSRRKITFLLKLVSED